MRYDAEWPLLALGDVAEAITVGHVGTMAAEYVPSGVPFLRSQNVRPFALDLTDLVYISPQFHTRLVKSALRSGDVIIVRTGVPGVAAVVPEDLGASNCSDLVIVRPGTRFDSRFLCYAINTLAREHVNAHLVGAVQQHFNVGSARVMRLPVPELDEQRAVAAVVGALDDKIALNRRMNCTLEATAAALFGKSCEGDEARSTPVRLDVLLGISTQSLAPAEMPDVMFDHYSIPAFDEGQLPAREFGSAIRSGKFRVASGAILLSKLNPRTPRVWWPAPSVDEHSVCSTEFVVCVPRDGVPQEFLYGLFRSRSFAEDLESLVTGTSNSHQRVKPADLLRMEVQRPPDGVMHRFAEAVRPMLTRTRANLLENRTLAALRDTLLPQLLSGAIRLRAAEDAVAAAL